MADRPRHPNKEIESAIQDLEAAGWSVDAPLSGHAWGRAYCRCATRDGCIASIWSTPKVPENHAAQLRRRIGQCQAQGH